MDIARDLVEKQLLRPEDEEAAAEAIHNKLVELQEAEAQTQTADEDAYRRALVESEPEWHRIVHADKDEKGEG